MVNVKNLLELAQNGDLSAESQIFDHLLVRFLFFAKRRVQSEESAEDIAQEACLTVVQKYKTEEFTVDFEAWAYGVLRMKIGNYLQKRKMERKTLSSSKFDVRISGITLAPDPDVRRRVLECLGRIIDANRNYARALNLVHKGYKTSEICRRLEVSSAHFYVILSRGRSMMRSCLETGSV